MGCRICGNPLPDGYSGVVCPSLRQHGKLAQHSACAAEMNGYRKGVGVVERLLANPHFRSSEAGHDAAVLRSMADRLEPVDPLDLITEALDQMERWKVPYERAADLSRRLGLARYRVEHGAGLTARQRRRGKP